MRVILAIIFLICTVDAFAQEPEAVRPKPSKVLKKKSAVVRTRGILSGGLGMVAERSNDNRTYEPRTLIFGRTGFEHGQHEVLLEVGGFKQETGSSGISVSRFHRQIDVWYHYLLFSRAPMGHPYLGLGLGVQRDDVTTTVFGSPSTSSGVFEAQLSVGGGYRFELGDTFAIWLEGRLATSKNYVPRILPSAVAAFGVRF